MVDITTWEQLHNIRNNLSGNYLLKNNLNRHSTGYDTYASSSANAGLGWLPIGQSSPYFTGEFDGGGYSISDMFINRFLDGATRNYIGLFGRIWTGGHVHDVEVLDVDFTGNIYVSGLAGVNYQGTVEKCGVSGDLDGFDVLGGLVALNSRGAISQSYADSNNRADSSIGGLVGWNDHEFSTIEDCYSFGTNTRKSGSIDTTIGGFVGYHAYGTIHRSFSTNKVTYEDATDPTDKGFAGDVLYGATGEIDYCYWNQDTSGQGTSQGEGVGRRLYGKLTPEMTDYPSYPNCYATFAMFSIWKPTTWNTDQDGNDEYIALNWQSDPTPPPSITKPIWCKSMKGVGL